MFTKVIVLFFIMALASAQLPRNVIDTNPKPYSFNYDVAGEDGSTHSRTESGDGSGGVRGSYSYTGPLGIFRIVDYISDSLNGFRATIRTNEPGTDNQNPADVQITAETPPAGAYEHRYQYNRRSQPARIQPARLQPARLQPIRPQPIRPQPIRPQPLRRPF